MTILPSLANMNIIYLDLAIPHNAIFRLRPECLYFNDLIKHIQVYYFHLGYGKVTEGNCTDFINR